MDWMTTAEVASALGVTEGTLYRWRKDGVGPKWHRIGRGVKYRAITIKLYIAEAEEGKIEDLASVA